MNFGNIGFGYLHASKISCIFLLEGRVPIISN